MAILAHGRPLITTKSEQDPSPLVHGRNVWLTTVDDPAALSDAIRKLAADGALREQLGLGAKEVSSLFTWDKIAVETTKLYHAVISGDNSDSNDAVLAPKTVIGGS
ncbi:MAG: hypothetical protein JSW55_13370 [Chloroflexota bacterium]|nr:MAG: hypothetical protein JSW55_13370 [Chloroflexota bacterium]